MRNIRDYLPSGKKKNEIIVFTSKINKAKWNTIKKFAAREKIRTQDIVDACFTHFIDEMMNHDEIAAMPPKKTSQSKQPFALT